MNNLSRELILKYLEELSTEIGKENLKGEILIFGGAAMVLAFNARPSTKDVDALFQPKSKIYELSKKIAQRHALPEYLLAMKSISMRIGVESSDVDDIRYLINHLELKKLDDIFDIVKRYYPRNQIPLKTYYALEEIFQEIIEGIEEKKSTGKHE